MKRKGILIVCACIALLLGLGTVKYFQISAAIAEGQKQGPPPVAVTSYAVKRTTWPDIIHSTGEVTARNGALLAAEASGRVEKISFVSGEPVEAGMVLIELDSKVEKAELERAEALLELANTTFRRQKALRRRNANAQSDLDEAQSSLRSASADVQRLIAVLERRQIIAPFSGRVGIRRVNVGDTVAIGDPMVSLNDSSSVYVDFSVSQESKSMLKRGLQVKVEVGSDVLFGELDSIEGQIDPSTRLLKARAVLENKEEVLLPGMFVDTSLILNQTKDVLVIPQASVSYAPYGNSVFIIPDSKIAASRSVQLGEKRGDFVSVKSGLEEGEIIAGSGAFKLYPGAQLIINNDVQLQNKENPTPQNS